jgi:hypothetical protein
MFITIIIIMLTAIIATPIILGLTIVSLVLGSMGVASILPLGVTYYVFGGLLGIFTGNGLQARLHIDAEARKFILGPFDWAWHIICFWWGNLFDFLLGSKPGPSREFRPSPRELPPGGPPKPNTAQRSSSGSPTALGSARTQRGYGSDYDEDMRDIEEILRKRGV